MRIRRAAWTGRCAHCSSSSTVLRSWRLSAPASSRTGSSACSGHDSPGSSRLRRPHPGCQPLGPRGRCCEPRVMAEETMTQTDAIARLKELVEDIDFTMLTTQDAAGNLVSRPMSTRQMDDNGTIWFFTAEDTKKVDEVHADHDVNLAYLDAKGMRFVTVA